MRQTLCPSSPRDEGADAMASGFTSALNGSSVTKRSGPVQPSL